ncbi:glycosyltransferase [Paenibacillus soyae]|uniref:Glycosyltransferase n=1 Tax=Paenibacillus soyae TaxID=2969249 RepID=A0A9X2MNL0_9BACL|nr:glycosyltransferase [Paenibacillus soyae]MCR2803981.1 glycosyltransferase [Paenibacillus soyae]
MTKKMYAPLLIALALIIGLAPAMAHGASSESAQVECIKPNIVKLQTALTKLWMDHAVWTKTYITSALADLQDQQDVLTRLLKNQQDIGDAIKPYYGDAAGNKLAELLKEHIAIAGQVVAAAEAGNQAAFNAANKEWHRNADDIAKFLSGANPNWAMKDLQNMLYIHLQLLTEQTQARLAKDWKKEIEAYDKGVDHLIMLADVLTQGIVKQFPEKF